MMFAPTAAAQIRTQRRFVICGLGGSGKTQFCCKFAQHHRQRLVSNTADPKSSTSRWLIIYVSFWGVFWIDASSDKTTHQAFARLAKVGGVDPNERAVKDWLSNLEDSWLLIIDSAENSEVKIETLFPEGERGHILITTRDPAHRVHGTIGPQSFEFSQLEHDAANHLLLRAACLPTPGDPAHQGIGISYIQRSGLSTVGACPCWESNHARLVYSANLSVLS